MLTSMLTFKITSSLLHFTGDSGYCIVSRLGKPRRLGTRALKHSAFKNTHLLVQTTLSLLTPEKVHVIPVAVITLQSKLMD